MDSEGEYAPRRFPDQFETRTNPYLTDPSFDLGDVVYLTGEALNRLPQNSAIYLTQSLSAVFESRKSLVADAKYTSTMLFWLLGAGGAVCGGASALFAKQGTAPPYGIIAAANIFASLLFLMIIPVGRTLLVKLEASYELYTAASIHSMLIHRAVGIPPECHRWLAFADYNNPEFRGHFTIRGVKGAFNSARVVFRPDLDGRKPQTVFEIEAAWKYQAGTLLHSYKRLVATISAIAVTAAVTSLVVAILSLKNAAA